MPKITPFVALAFSNDDHLTNELEPCVHSCRTKSPHGKGTEGSARNGYIGETIGSICVECKCAAETRLEERGDATITTLGANRENIVELTVTVKEVKEVGVDGTSSTFLYTRSCPGTNFNVFPEHAKDAVEGVDTDTTTYSHFVILKVPHLAEISTKTRKETDYAKRTKTGICAILTHEYDACSSC